MTYARRKRLVNLEASAEAGGRGSWTLLERKSGVERGHCLKWLWDKGEAQIPTFPA